MINLGKYSWNEMELCKSCHYKDDDPDICNFNDSPEEKPGVFNCFTGCGRYLRESKFQRMTEEQFRQSREDIIKNRINKADCP